MSGRILYRGVPASDAHPLHPGPGPESKQRPPSEGGEDAESLDPRIQIELEKLNKASEDINRLELQLDEARAKFRQVLTESTQMLNLQAKKLGSCIEKARPYYDARIKAKEAQTDTQNAALRYERACGQVTAAKEMVYLAEDGFFQRGQKFDPAWQEMLNHATIKVNDAEREKYESQVEHQRTAQLFSDAEQFVKRLQKELRRNIAKSRPYFEMKASVNQQMEEQKQYVGRLESEILTAKRLYGTTLSNLERISDEIHHQRREGRIRKELGQRGVGVGAEAPSVVGDKESAIGRTPASGPGNGHDVQRDPLQGHVVITRPAKLHEQKSRVVESSHSSSSQSKANGTVHGNKKAACGSNTDEIVCAPSSLASKGKDVAMCPSSIPSKQYRSPSLPDTAITSPSLPYTNPQPVVLRRKKIASESRILGKHPPRRYVTSPTMIKSSNVPVVRVTSCISAPTSPTNPDDLNSEDLRDRNVRANAELMESLQRQKSKPCFPGLRSNKNSHDDLLSLGSDTESLSGSVASASMLDDEQIDSLMMEMVEYTKFLERLDVKQAKKWKRLSLPSKLSYAEKNFDLQDFLSEIRMPEDADEEVFTENSAQPPIAEEEDLSTTSMENDSNTYGTQDLSRDDTTDPNISDDDECQLHGKQ